MRAHRYVIWSAVALIGGFAVAADGEPANEALEILKKVDTAAKKVSAARFHATVKPTGVAERFLSPSEGVAYISGWANGNPERFRAHVKSNRDGQPIEVTGGGNGDMFFLVDHVNKKAYEDMDPGVVGSFGNVLGSIGMAEFVHDAPFDDELGAETIELLGEETVAGEECWKVRVVYSGGQGESIWSFAKKDHLPRRRVRMFEMQGEKGSLEITLSKLEIEPQVDPASLKLELPPGYELVDDFAP